ncbi:pentapeptide repeat-containing protein [Sphaerisporangium album]|uniref:pentapeptide repeat-containing protein n=1 Tax=Sphaerisporangium album TaxID=509200 RepID=UPI0015F10785|nr:pentapeptide repeat-containing protein [Sphaerisporangium album]
MTDLQPVTPPPQTPGRWRRPALALIYLGTLTACAVAAFTAVAPDDVLRRFGLASAPDWARWTLAGLALSGVVALGLAVLLGPAARRLAGERQPLTDEERRQLSVTDRLEAVNATRQTLLQSATGLVVIGGVVFTALSLWYTARTLDTTQQGQVTDRYTKAIDQLGNRQSLDVRLGGIYALERLATDSPRDHRTIYDVLAAFTREHDPAPKTKTTGPPATDIQAALTVIGRRSTHDATIDLATLRAPKANLTRADLARADLARADLTGANLTYASLTGASLTGAYMNSANLFGANLISANLISANLDSANLTLAYMNGANLNDARLAYAYMNSANLTGANLTGANLTHVNLPGAILVNADLTGLAILAGSNLAGANLAGANLGADLNNPRIVFTPNRAHASWEQGADLANVDLTRANLTRANLTRVNLTYANLTRADLTGANLTYANLTRADLTGADLTGAILSGVRGLTEIEIKAVAKTDATTQF